MEEVVRRADESLYAAVEKAGSPLARTFGYAERLAEAGLLGGGGNVEPTAVLRIRSRQDDVVVYEQVYRFGLSDAIAAKERFVEELRTLTEAEFKERYAAP